MTVIATSLGDGVRLLTIDRPPVNALSFAVCADLVAAVTDAERDPAVTTVVFAGANGVFSGGADLNELDAVPAPGTPTLRDAIAAIERGAKTFVAAIDGVALGGGFELALACDYRVATAGARLGLPEITLGLLPGAGGTQRLPRLIGATAALRMMLDGESITAAAAHAAGILDDVVASDPAAAAQRWAAWPKRRVSALPAGLGMANPGLFATPFAVASAHKTVPPEERGGFAAHKLIDAVEAAIELPFARGLAREARLFGELVQSRPSAALRHLFAAEREAARVPGLDRAAAQPVSRAGVIGAGAMGTAIAIAFAQAGIPAVVVESRDEQIARARETVAGTFHRQVAKGRLSDDDARRCTNAVSFSSRFEDVRDVDLVVEAVFESMEVKARVFEQLDALVRPGAILATNTSTLDVDAIAAHTGRPDRVLGLHFFAPANVMKLLEIVRGKATSATTLATAIGLAKRLRKVGVVSGNAFGFIGNRMLFAYQRAAVGLAEEGVNPLRIDRVMKERFGFAMGPLAVADLSGLDVYRHIERSAGGMQLGRIPLVEALTAAGRLGQKTGKGIFRYDPAAGNGREPLADPEVEQLVATLARDAGIAPAPEVSDEAIVRRCTLPLVETGAQLLVDGVALRPGDIDLVWVYGYGFPPYRGGPMWYARETGDMPAPDVTEPAHA